MEQKKPSPIWLRVVLFLGCCALALIVWAFAVGPLWLYLILPLFRKLTVGENALGIWLLLALLTELLRDRSRTWIVSYGEQLESITWFYQNVWYYNTMIP